MVVRCGKCEEIEVVSVGEKKKSALLKETFIGVAKNNKGKWVNISYSEP